jgi:exodeoxyribonuclease VII large subunit
VTGFLWGDEADEFFAEAKRKRIALDGNPSETRSASSKGTSKERENTALSVSELNAWIKAALEQSIPSFALIAEVGSITKSGAGHLYLTLKDASNQISAVIWRSTWERCRFDIREGMAVLCTGKLDVYGPRGSYQIVVQKIEPQGLGPLQIAFRKLYAKLEAEGLFRSERKRPLPKFPSRIGFVTSPHGAAIHDFLEVLRRRWPQTNVLVIPAKVQGEGAAAEIAQGIELAGRIMPPLDILIVGRGGGSIEDLWAFNEEPVVRAVVASPIPVVSAVGHEIDVTLCDLASDVRALTPSEAAERVVPNRDEIAETILSLQSRVAMVMNHKVRELDTRLKGLASRPVLSNPERMFDTPTQRLDEFERMVEDAVARSMDLRKHQFEKLASRLESISPLKTLARGYSLTTLEPSGQIVSDASQVSVGSMLRTRVGSGEIRSQVVTVKPE